MPASAFPFAAFQAAFAPGSTLLLPGSPAVGTSRLAALLHDAARQRLFLLDGAATAGPITPARYQELAAWATRCALAKVYVSAFTPRAAFTRHALRIAPETEVWLADAPQHLIHYRAPQPPRA